MKYLAIVLLLMTPIPTLASFQTTQPTTQASSSSGEEIGPLLPILAVGVVLVCLLILIGVGLALGLLVIGVVAILLLMGILSTSIIVGLKDKRLESSARAFVVQLAAVVGAFGGGALFCVAAALKHVHRPLMTIMGLGILVGIVSGIIVGWLLDKVWRRVRAYIIAKKSPTV